MEQSRILVVDDDKEIREIIRVLLTQEGYDVSEARNGTAKGTQKDKAQGFFKGRMIILPNRFPTRNYWCV